MQLKITEEQRKTVFKNLRSDFKNAKKAKTEIEKKIIDWIDLYEGTNEQYSMVNGGSKYISREVARQAEYIKPNLSEPFVSISHPVRITSSNRNETAKRGQHYLNQVFTGEFDRVTFMDNISDRIVKEGTVWVKVGWNHIKKAKLEYANNLTIDDVIARGQTPVNAKTNEDGSINVAYKTTKVVKNYPTAQVVRNECCYPDPTARSDDDMRFFIFEEEMTLSDLRISGKYDQDDLDRLKNAVESDSSDSALNNDRRDRSNDYGRDSSYTSSDASLKKVKVLTYYGEQDIDEDGIAEPIMGQWVDKHNIDLLLIENPMPSKRIPFYRATYSSDSDVLWGKALAFFIGDNQKAMTGMTRAMFDNMSIANNGQKFVQKNMLDYVNMTRMRKGERIILTNRPPEDGIVNGKFNQMPQSFFNVFTVIKAESEELSGANKNLATTSTNKDDNEFQMTLAQQRMAGCVRNVGNLLSKVFREWLELAAIYMEDEDIERLYPEGAFVDYGLFDELDDMNISLKVATDAQRAASIKQLNLLMQQSKSLGERTPPDTIPNITAEMLELYDKYDEAEKMRNYNPQPSQEQIMAMQMDLKQKELDLAKTQAEIEEINARRFNYMAGGQAKLMDSQAGAGYKQTQGIEKLAKAESHGVNSSLAPVQVLDSILNKGGSPR